ncbi:hypothetical protein, partial [Stomatobaculum longum]|uniref:hypothetical protein n=1 Tax=Stomatobaculum longum TaxID=796942 RepID=UPI0028055CD0
ALQANHAQQAKAKSFKQKEALSKQCLLLRPRYFVTLSVPVCASLPQAVHKLQASALPVAGAGLKSVPHRS